ncbi:AAA family ATPase [Tamaricihabitans halophyticus]|uniref:MinD/ParA family ATP-binding protein n=1 Tax=Tamaricihabitans halophyticus TaxID=1262583 RepID=UPI003C7164F0
MEPTQANPGPEPTQATQAAEPTQASQPAQAQLTGPTSPAMQPVQPPVPDYGSSQPPQDYGNQPQPPYHGQPPQLDYSHQAPHHQPYQQSDPTQAPLPPLAPHQPAAQRPTRGHGGQPLGANDLSSAQLLKPKKRTPQSGWRKAVYQVTGHLVNLGESPADQHRRELIGRVNQPLRGCYKIAMLSLKGGVGKTTTTTTLGSTFASLRGDRVIAVDANPDRGTLSQKIPLETTATVRHLLRDADRVRKYSDVRSYTSQGPSRLEVLASEQDPAVSEAYSEQDYRRTIDLLEHFYNIVLTDCGTGLMHSAMRGVLGLADSLVLVSSGSVDGARSALATLDWLDAHGYGDLVARSVAVINSVRSKGGSVDLDKLVDHFSHRCRAVCRIPFDPHLEEGAEIELDRLAPATRLALLELASTVADGFPNEGRTLR